jgi:hypothetical protein
MISETRLRHYDHVRKGEMIRKYAWEADQITCTLVQNVTRIFAKHEKKWIRALYALPFILILYGCSQTMGASIRRAMPSRGSR